MMDMLFISAGRKLSHVYMIIFEGRKVWKFCCKHKFLIVAKTFHEKETTEVISDLPSANYKTL